MDRPLHGRDVRRIEKPIPAPEAAAAIPMRVVTRLTGLSADTVRVWERRHRAIVPVRTEGNARRYTELEVRRLKLLREAVARGHSIGEVARLRDDELLALGLPDASELDADPVSVARRDYFTAVERLDQAAGAGVLAAAAARLSPRSLALDLVVPMMREVGERWHEGALTVAQEHFATQQVRSLVLSLARSLDIDGGAPRVVFAAPETHLHDMGLVVGSLLSAARGVQPILLGADLPLAELGAAARRARAAVVVVAVARDLRDDEKRTLPVRLRKLASELELWIGAPPDHLVARTPGARVLSSFEQLDTALAARFG